jgi:hypothetical protein
MPITPSNLAYKKTDPVVYVIQESQRNMTSALDFGSLEALLEERDEATMLNIPRLVEKIKHGLRYFTKDDYLLLIGSPVSIGIACAVAAEMTGGVFQVLKWDGQEKRYWQARVNLNQSDR